MRILVGYPPLNDDRGFIQVGQNRQSKIFSVGEEAAIFPCVMAWAATLLTQQGHEVKWLDAQTDHSWSHSCPPVLQCYLHYLEDEWKPDLILWEAKTPSIKATWKAVDAVKALLPHCKVVLCGDHVTALPEETLANSSTDIVLTGGDYDFGVLCLVKAIEDGSLEWSPQWSRYVSTHTRTVKSSNEETLEDSPL